MFRKKMSCSTRQINNAAVKILTRNKVQVFQWTRNRNLIQYFMRLKNKLPFYKTVYLFHKWHSIFYLFFFFLYPKLFNPHRYNVIYNFNPQCHPANFIVMAVNYVYATVKPPTFTYNFFSRGFSPVECHNSKKGWTVYKQPPSVV